MTDEETIKAVTARLRGEFYVGQRVRINAEVSEPATGTIVKQSNLAWHVLLDGRASATCLFESEIRPA